MKTRKRSHDNTTIPNLIGAAGEYHVLCQLLLHGYIAALAPRGVPNTDIVVSDLHSKRLFSVQVKARQNKGADGGWHMSAKHERLVSPTLFYAFVDFGDVGISPPRTWVLSSALVAHVVAEMHRAYIAIPGAKGQQRRDTKFRRLTPDYALWVPGAPYGAGWMDRFHVPWPMLGAPPEIQTKNVLSANGVDFDATPA